MCLDEDGVVHVSTSLKCSTTGSSKIVTVFTPSWDYWGWQGNDATVATKTSATGQTAVNVRALMEKESTAVHFGAVDRIVNGGAPKAPKPEESHDTNERAKIAKRRELSIYEAMLERRAAWRKRNGWASD